MTSGEKLNVSETFVLCLLGLYINLSVLTENKNVSNHGVTFLLELCPSSGA